MNLCRCGVFAAVLMAVAGMILAGPPNARSGQPLFGTVQVSSAVHHDISPPLRSMKPVPGNSLFGQPEEENDRRGLIRRPSGLSVKQFVDPVLQEAAGPLLAANLGVQFDGLSADNGWVVPDTNGAIGPTQFVEWVNTQLAVFDRTTGTILLGPENGSTLWQGFGGLCESNNNGDPLAQYDKQAGRWVLTQHAIAPVGKPSLQCVAVSATSDATGSYYRYAFQLPINDFPDYPKIATWPDGYYLSIDEFLQTNLKVEVGPYICALDRTSMLQGLNATSQCFLLPPNFLSLLPSDWDGANPPPAGSPNYFMSLGSNSLNLWRLHVDFANSQYTNLIGPITIPVAHFVEPCNTGGICIPQGGVHQKLDSIGDRLMYRLAYRNFGDHESLVAVHAVGAKSVVGLRWYEIRSPGSTPVIYQQRSSAPDSNYRWMASIAMDKIGDIAIGYSASGTQIFPSIRITGRRVTDRKGSLETEVNILSGAGAETGSDRWGDYSSLLIDPLDDCTFWFTGEYLPSTGDHNWRTHIVSFAFPGCTAAPGKPGYPTGDQARSSSHLRDRAAK